MTIKLHHLQPAAGSRKDKIRVGRGDRGRRGKTAGRGTKGTRARNTVSVGHRRSDSLCRFSSSGGRAAPAALAMSVMHATESVRDCQRGATTGPT